MTTFRDLLDGRDVSLYVGYNRYGGGFSATLVHGFDLECMDRVFAHGDEENVLGTWLLSDLGLMYTVDDDPVKAVDELLSSYADLEEDQFKFVFDKWKWAISKTDNLRPIIENGELAREILKDSLEFRRGY